MSQPNPSLPSASFAPARGVSTPGLPAIDEATATELAVLLARAAELAAAHGVANEAFMSAAWNALLDAQPGLREELEDKELRAQLRKLRRRGLMASA